MPCVLWTDSPYAGCPFDPLAEFGGLGVSKEGLRKVTEKVVDCRGDVYPADTHEQPFRTAQMVSQP
jgi:hypothetical protein